MWLNPPGSAKEILQMVGFDKLNENIWLSKVKQSHEPT